MSRTVSFRASEELDDHLEQLAEERMTTKSTVANMLVAERVRQLRGETGGSGGSWAAVGESTESEGGKSTGLPPIFEKHRDRWYRPDTEEDYKFAIRMPEESGTHTKYYKTTERAAERLKEEYE